MFIKPTISDMSHRCMNEDWERISELDKMWLLEKEAEMFVEWQRWEDEHQLPAIIEFTPLLVKDEVESDFFSFP